MPTDVKYFHHAMTGAPALSGTPGSLIAVLDACLVDGFGLGTLDSLVVASDVATATRSAGHPFQVGSVVTIAGVTGGAAALNAQWRVTEVVSGTQYRFATTGIADQTAAGTITHKLAPAGWSNSAVSGGSSTLKAYRFTDAGSLQMYLRVDDSPNYHARVVGYEAMSDVNTGTGPFPTEAQLAGGGYIPRSSTADATVRPWYLVADKRGFYFLPCHYSTFLQMGPLLWFGEIVPQGVSDSAHCVLQPYHQAGNLNYSSQGISSLLYFAQPAVWTWAARPYTGIGSSVAVAKFMDMSAPLASSSRYSGVDTATHCLTPYPNGADNGLLLAAIRAYDGPTYTLRGRFPGLYGTPQRVPDGNFAQGDSVGAVGSLPGRVLRMFRSMFDAATPAHGAIDCSGPWR